MANSCTLVKVLQSTIRSAIIPPQGPLDCSIMVIRIRDLERSTPGDWNGLLNENNDAGDSKSTPSSSTVRPLEIPNRNGEAGPSKSESTP
ncbi:hypothetical protein LINGRAHAP2_LOCUS15463 [Linum grandiflorum]